MTSPPVSRDIGVLRAGWGYASISDKIADLVLTRPVRWPWLGTGAASLTTPCRSERRTTAGPVTDPDG